ncbi:LPXTG cell wall anchor domain-containing protein, partial [Listeria monocytogenes]|uniref:LPXTG cell wall anchor domain-containing protein n=1 Tax=Listeria monocytogenes TaxID=1639 RepID=UPI000A980274
SQTVTYVYERTSNLSISPSNKGTENVKQLANLPHTGDSTKTNLWVIIGLLMLSGAFVIMLKG